jgi:hypothetical protein
MFAGKSIAGRWKRARKTVRPEDPNVLPGTTADHAKQGEAHAGDFGSPIRPAWPWASTILSQATRSTRSAREQRSRASVDVGPAKHEPQPDGGERRGKFAGLIPGAVNLNPIPFLFNIYWPSERAGLTRLVAVKAASNQYWLPSLAFQIDCLRGLDLLTPVVDAGIRADRTHSSRRVDFHLARCLDHPLERRPHVPPKLLQHRQGGQGGRWRSALWNSPPRCCRAQPVHQRLFDARALRVRTNAASVLVTPGTDPLTAVQ